MMFKKFIIVLVGIILISLSLGYSANIINNQNGNWNNSAIWNTSAVPTINDNVTINATTFVIITSSTNASTNTLTINGNLSTTTGNLTITGLATINSGGILGNNTSWIFNQSNELDVLGSGIFNAPNAGGSWYMGGTLRTGGTFNHDNGKLTFTAGLLDMRAGAWTFYDILTASGILQVYQGSYTVVNSINATSGSTFQFQNRDGAGTITITLGNASQAATVTATGNINIATGGGASTLTLQAGSPSYPWIMSGVGPQASVPSTMTLQNGVINGDFTTSTGNNDIYIAKNMTFNNTVLISSGDNFTFSGGFNYLNNTFNAVNGSVFNVSNANLTATDTGNFTIAGIGYAELGANITLTNVSLVSANITFTGTSKLQRMWRASINTTNISNSQVQATIIAYNSSGGQYVSTFGNFSAWNFTDYITNSAGNNSQLNLTIWANSTPWLITGLSTNVSGNIGYNLVVLSNNTIAGITSDASASDPWITTGDSFAYLIGNVTINATFNNITQTFNYTYQDIGMDLNASLYNTIGVNLTLTARPLFRINISINSSTVNQSRIDNMSLPQYLRNFTANYETTTNTNEQNWALYVGNGSGYSSALAFSTVGAKIQRVGLVGTDTGFPLTYKLTWDAAGSGGGSYAITPLIPQGNDTGNKTVLPITGAGFLPVSSTPFDQRLIIIGLLIVMVYAVKKNQQIKERRKATEKRSS